MAYETKTSVGAGLRTLFEVGTVVGSSDGELLDLFLTTGGPAAELAFVALVERHGPMVWRVCRDTLRESNDADDAFQATFLVLVRRAGAIRKRSSLGPWLHGVALRVARSARRCAIRRRDRERVDAGPGPEESMAHVDRLDEAPILHEEVDRLPAKYREPLVLCYFQGLTHDEAASQLGWPVGTVRSRLAEARVRLRPRLLKRGVAPSVAILAASGQAEAAAVVPAALVSATIKSAVGAGAGGTVPAAVAALVRTTLREMFLMKTSMIATGLVAAALVATACVGFVSARPQDPVKAVAPRPDGADPKSDAARKITVAAVQAKAVTVTYQYACQIHAHRHIDVRALADGNIKAVPVKEGQAVKRNDLLFQLEALGDDGKPDAEKAEIWTKIKAPFDGIIGRLPRQQGSFVRTGESLTTLSDNGEMWVYFNVPEKRYLEFMAEGPNPKISNIELVLASNSKFPHLGNIDTAQNVGAVEGEFNHETGNIAFRADFPNPERLLRHGQTGVVSIGRVLKDALVIPQRATFEAGAKRYVYVVDKDDVAHRREITIKNEVDDEFVVEAGIKVGDRIVSDGVGKVHDGDKLKD